MFNLYAIFLKTCSEHVLQLLLNYITIIERIVEMKNWI